jgi:hypothetical protein
MLFYVLDKKLCEFSMFLCQHNNRLPKYDEKKYKKLSNNHILVVLGI